MASWDQLHKNWLTQLHSLSTLHFESLVSFILKLYFVWWVPGQATAWPLVSGTQPEQTLPPTRPTLRPFSTQYIFFPEKLETIFDRENPTNVRDSLAWQKAENLQLWRPGSFSHMPPPPYAHTCTHPTLLWCCRREVFPSKSISCKRKRFHSNVVQQYKSWANKQKASLHPSHPFPSTTLQRHFPQSVSCAVKSKSTETGRRNTCEHSEEVSNYLILSESYIESATWLAHMTECPSAWQIRARPKEISSPFARVGE